MPTFLKLRDLVGDLRHFASVRRVTFEDGPERGLEALLVTAGPLAFTILAGRAMDIGSLTWRGVSVGWTGPSGYVAPAYINPDAEGGLGFTRGLSGFLMTGGLTHIRQPEGDEPLHGRLPFTPARIVAAHEDWQAGTIRCEGEIRQTRHGRENLLLRRRIEVPVSGAAIRISDVVINQGATAVVPELLYHFNLGYPAVADGTSVALNGHEILAPVMMPDPGQPAPPVCVKLDPGASECRVVSGHSRDRFEMTLRISASSLPCLQLWRDMRPRAGIFSIEPCTSMPGEKSEPLQPGECRRYETSIFFSGFQQLA